MSQDFFLQTLVPITGTITATLMYLSPTKAILKAHEQGYLGDLNPLPMILSVTNTVAWIAYAFLKLDPYVVTPNVIGLPFGLYATILAYGLAEENVRYMLRQVLLISVCFLTTLGVYTNFFLHDFPNKQLDIWGVAANATCLIYYGAPLSTMAQVIRTSNSSSILLALTIMAAANSGLWTAYGMAIGDLYVSVPNGVGLLLAGLQVMLKLIYPSPRSGYRKQTGDGLRWNRSAV